VKSNASPYVANGVEQQVQFAPMGSALMMRYAPAASVARGARALAEVEEHAGDRAQALTQRIRTATVLGDRFTSTEPLVVVLPAARDRSPRVVIIATSSLSRSGFPPAMGRTLPRPQSSACTEDTFRLHGVGINRRCVTRKRIGF
jgi:hypothetical protein